MQINGPGQTYRVHGPEQLGGPHRVSKPADAAQPTDQVEISPAAQEAARLAEAAEARAAGGADGGVRSDVVSRIRQEIAAGTYETPEKIDAALDRVIDQLG